MECVMSGGLLQYSGLVTKTRAMHGRLLSKENYIRLSEYENVEEFIAFLREYGNYAPTYRSHEEIHHRAQVEAVINDSLYADYMKLYRFAGIQQRKGLEILFFRYEVNVLKASLEYVKKGGREYMPGELNSFFDGHTCYDTSALVQAKNMQEFMMALEGTRYEGLMRRMTENPGLRFADYASQLDIYYYQNAWKMKDALAGKKMRSIFTRILGTEIDWLNIMWMYRFKRFYNMKTADIAVNMIPIQYRLKKQETRKLLDAGNLSEFESILAKTVYFTEKDAVVKLGDEITFRHIMDRTYDQICRKYPMSVAPVLKYLYDKENEIDILTTILEGVRYRIPAREIQELVLTHTI